MEESVTYQAILKRGAIREVRKLILMQGRFRFGIPPGTRVRRTLGMIEDLRRSENLAVSALGVRSWEEFLDLPLVRGSCKKPQP